MSKVKSPVAPTTGPAIGGDEAESLDRQWRSIEASVIAVSDKVATDSDFTRLAVAGIVDRRFEDEDRRLQRVRRCLEACPSLEALEQTEQQLEADRPTLEAERAELKKELAEVAGRINRRLSEIDNAIRAAETKTEAMRNARARLRELVPQHVNQIHRHKLDALNMKLHKAVCEAEVAVQVRESIVAMSPTSTETVAASAHWRPGHIADIGTVHIDLGERESHVAKELPKVQARFRAELPALRSKAAQLRAEYDQQKAAIKNELDYYLIHGLPTVKAN